MKIIIAGTNANLAENVIANRINNSEAATFIHMKTLSAVIGGELRNAHETGTSINPDTFKGGYTTKHRKHMEYSHFFGKRTVYGMLVNKKRIQEEFKHGEYGNVALIWSRRKRDEATATLGDSMKAPKAGRPALSLYGVIGRDVQHWLAQYNIYPSSQVPDWDNPDHPEIYGIGTRKPNYTKFDVDKSNMVRAFGRYKDYVETQGKGPFKFPVDFQAIVVDNSSLRDNLEKYFRSRHWRIRVLTDQEYDYDV